MAPPIPVPPTDRVFVERFAEPITGWAMVGAGADWTAGPFPGELEAEVRYDGSPRVQATVRWEALDTRTARYHFGVQLPVEADARRVSVVLRDSDREVTLFDGDVQSLKDRAEPAPNGKPMPRWLSPAMTLGRSVATGEVFSADWWTARVRRYREFAIKGRQKVRDRLLIRAGHRPRSVHDAYVERTSLTPADLAAMAELARRFRFKPTISVLVPVYIRHDDDVRWLREAVDSVRQQVYPYWELCLSDDASPSLAAREYLNRLPRDPRIKVARRADNGHICAATNSAAELATGEFVALLDNDDILAPHALFAVARLLQSHPDADLVYSDEDKIDAAGRRYDPQFKPGWSPELLLSYNYVNHLTVLRRSAFEKVGRFRPGYEGSQDHDLLLRVTERTDRVHHVPEILYHWRSLSTSTAAAAGVKGYVHTSGRRAVENALARRGIAATLYVPPFAERLGLPILALDGPDDGLRVAILVRGKADAAARTARVVKQTTAYKNYTVYLVIDDAPPADALNRTAAGRSEELLLFLEAGTEPADPRWLSRLVANLLPGVGAAGGLVTDPDGRIVSAGTVLGMADGALPRDAFAGQAPDPASYYFYAEVTRNVAAPARGCLLTRRAVFDRLGGFDADRFGRTLWDVDYCLRLAGLGLRSVHVGGAGLRSSQPTLSFSLPPCGGGPGWGVDATPSPRSTPHPNPPPQGGKEPAAGRHDLPSEQRALRLAHGGGPDPYYNPNLSAWDSFAPLSEAPHLIPAFPAEPVPVLFGTHNLTAFEGAPKIIQDVATGLTRRGAVVGQCFAPAPGPAAAAYEAAGVPVFADETPYARRFVDGQWAPSEYAAAQARLGKLLRRLRPRVVVANTLGLFPLVEAAARHGIPAILAIQESYPADLFARAFSPYGRWRCERAFLFAERVVFASRACADLYRRLDGRKNFEVIHNGLAPGPFDDYLRRVSKADAAADLPGPADRLRVVTVGTVCERKAQHVLVEAAAKVARERRDFACLLVGARAGLPYLGYVRNLIRARGLDDVVVPVGETDRVWTYLRAADVFVCCSYVEAFSLSVLEAEAFGLPVVSTACGGLDEQVAWGRSALKFDFGDADRLADHLRALLADAELRAEMGRQSRAAFELSLTADGMLDRYQRAILAAAGVKAAAASARPRARVA